MVEVLGVLWFGDGTREGQLVARDVKSLKEGDEAAQMFFPGKPDPLRLCFLPR